MPPFMSKHQFTDAQRFAVWQHHGQKCYWCGKPMDFLEATVDHLIPEHLQDKPEEFARLRHQYGLLETFAINDYANWLPAHEKCNKNKGGIALPAVPLIVAISEKLQREAPKVRIIEDRIKGNLSKAKLLVKLKTAVESEKITKDEIFALFSDPDLPDDEDVQTLRRQVSIHVNPQRWRVIHFDVGSNVATVTDGRFAGVTPVVPNPDISWMCPNCGSYGPWNGVVCLNCGRMSDPND
jgi:hypothetical protein